MLVLNELMGLYRPGYFEIYINSDDEIDLSTLSRTKLATFFHEWIHFIQDFTTGVGCNNSYARIELLKYAGKKSETLPEPVKLPITIGSEMNVRANEFIRVKEWGYGPVTNVNFSTVSGFRNEETDIPACLISGSSLSKVAITKAYTDSGEGFVFGTQAIMESMAFECQIYLYPDTASGHAIYPYHTARLVANHILPGFTDDRLRLIALCDMSLMSSAPGPQFTSYLQNIKNRTIPYPDSPEDVYDWFYRNGLSLINGYQKINSLTKRSFLGILKDPIVFKSFHNWINNAYDKALNIRLYDRYFLLESLRGGELYQNNKVQNLINEFGTPLMRNNKYEYTKIPLAGNDDWDVEHLQSSWEVNDFLTLNTYNGCSLLRWCHNSDKEKIKKSVPEQELIHPDKRCIVNPSERSNDNQKCPFALVWYAMGLPNAKRI